MEQGIALYFQPLFSSLYNWHSHWKPLLSPILGHSGSEEVGSGPELPRYSLCVQGWKGRSGVGRLLGSSGQATAWRGGGGGDLASPVGRLLQAPDSSPCCCSASGRSAGWGRSSDTNRAGDRLSEPSRMLGSPFVLPRFQKGGHPKTLKKTSIWGR
jgi:hypothetical protein